MREDALVALDGPANFRDLGGHTTTDGGTIRAGRVFRSDSLSYLSGADVEALRDRLGIRTVIDLRSPPEVGDHGHGPLSLLVDQRHMPIVDQTRQVVTRRLRFRRQQQFQRIDEIYLHMLSTYGDRFGLVLKVIADADRHPLVFHCAAGKDRTGLVAALVLGLCDVPDEDIAADFAYTESRMPEIIARNTERTGAAPPTAGAGTDATPTDVTGGEVTGAEVTGQQYGALPAAMMTVLEQIRERHGSLADYAVRIGLSVDDIDDLRAALVVPRR
jgi:protein-tyrosine phosphatase